MPVSTLSRGGGMSMEDILRSLGWSSEGMTAAGVKWKPTSGGINSWYDTPAGKAALRNAVSRRSSSTPAGSSPSFMSSSSLPARTSVMPSRATGSYYMGNVNDRPKLLAGAPPI